MEPEIRQAIMGHTTGARSVDERYGWISDEEFVRAIDGMTFEHGGDTDMGCEIDSRTSRIGFAIIVASR